MAVNEPSPEGRGLFIYVAIIPWQPVDKCYMSCIDRAARCHWSYATETYLIGRFYSSLLSNERRCLALVTSLFSWVWVQVSLIALALTFALFVSEVISTALGGLTVDHYR